MEDFPENVMVDILSRLPVKTIIHCKCVCNKWRNIVSDCYFANLHLLRSPTGLMIHHNSRKELNAGYHKPGVLKWVEVEDEVDHHNLHHDPLMSLDLNFAPIFQHSVIRPLGSVNGLICLWKQIGPGSLDNTYICNPITREYMILPSPRLHRQVHQIFVYGFGVGSLTREYKVIQILRGDGFPVPTLTSEAEIYTVGTGQWRSLGHVPFWPNGISGTFLNGHAHWSVFHHGKICAFDFDTETFDWFPSPPVEESQTHSESLGVLKGCLCRCDVDDSQFWIWVMKEYGIEKSWHKELVIKKSISPDLNWLIWTHVYLIEGFKDGTILIGFYDDKLVAYFPHRDIIVDTEIFDRFLIGMAYRPSFLKLHNFELERVHVF